MSSRPLSTCALVFVAAMAMLAVGCSQQVDGRAVPLGTRLAAGTVDIDDVLLGPEQMRALTDSTALTLRH